jgi:hypothetical protein
MGVDNVTISTCDVCERNYGLYPICGAIYTPDPLDGQLKECSGHGTYVDGTCLCYFNSTAGYWRLHPFDNVLTCIGCDPDQPAENCVMAQPTSQPSSGPFLATVPL